MLIVFLVYLSSPGYPDSKKKTIQKTIHNLPVNQDMGTKAWRYSEGDDKIELEAMKQEDCDACWDTLNNAIRCRRCVELRGDCKDCCFSGEDPATGIIKCTEDDNEDYACKSELFDRDDCDPIVCDTDKCNTKCTDYTYDADSLCNRVEEKETGGEVDDKAVALRWHRKGCPEEDSPDLAPNDDSCTEVSGSGLDRIWKCPSDGLKPNFADNYLDKSQCLPDSDLTFTHSKPDSTWGYGDYYAVTKVEPNCAASYECSSSCSIQSCSKGNDGDCYKDKECSPSSCVPKNCHTKEESVCSYSCVSETACITADKSTHDCECDNSRNDQCTPNSCAPSCSSKGCEKTCSSECAINTCQSASDTYYVYVLSDKYKDYIAECIAYANDYDACMDRVNCCKKGVCPYTSGKDKKTKEYDCAPGFSDNCKYCKKRECYHNDINDNCKEFTAIDAKNSCPQLASDVHGCLTKPDNSECFKEIKTGDGPFYYSYVASSNDALNIIWQVVSSSPDKDVKGLNFYTLVKVWKLDADGNPEEAVHTSMANVKSQEAAFSIYGTTNVAKDKLAAGASYQVRLYYFLPPGEFCRVECECPDGDDDCKAEACEDTNKIELTYLSLILQRIRE